jgi:hypothetical protein
MKSRILHICSEGSCCVRVDRVHGNVRHGTARRCRSGGSADSVVSARGSHRWTWSGPSGCTRHAADGSATGTRPWFGMAIDAIERYAHRPVARLQPCLIKESAWRSSRGRWPSNGRATRPSYPAADAGTSAAAANRRPIAGTPARWRPEAWHRHGRSSLGMTIIPKFPRASYPIDEGMGKKSHPRVWLAHVLCG